MTAALLEVRNLEKRFGRKPVLRGVTLELAAGRHVGLVGNNGQGKTTLMRLILGLLRPDGGEIRIQGEPAHFPRTRAQKLFFGYLPESVRFYGNLTGRRTLRFLARLKGVAPREAEPLLELVGLADAADERVGTYSKGMQQRLGLAQALLGEPRLLLLDEPTNGLDPQGIRDFYAILERLQGREVAILTASHLLAEIEPRLDHLVLLEDGRFARSGSVRELIAQAGLEVRIKLVLKGARPRLLPVLEKLGAHPSPNGRPHTYEIRCAEEAKLGVLGELLRHGNQLDGLSVKEPGLEEVFHHHQLGGAAVPPPRRGRKGGRS